MSGKSDASKFLVDEVLDPSDPHVRASEAFPSPTADQVERVSSFGVVRRLPHRAVLYERGDRTADFFVVLDGFAEAHASHGAEQRVEPNTRHCAQARSTENVLMPKRIHANVHSA